MPRQSDTAENNPGEKAMMRKLAVTVFALSLAALGCGSDSGNKTPDTGVAIDGAKTDVVTPNPDIAQTPDAPMGPEASLDTTKVDVSTPDLPQTLDQAQSLDQALGVDQAPPTVDTAKTVDTQGIDGAKPSVDGSVDTKRADAGAAVDSGSVDGGSAG
jgi:hypothetical protein